MMSLERRGNGSSGACRGALGLVLLATMLAGCGSSHSMELQYLRTSRLRRVYVPPGYTTLIRKIYHHRPRSMTVAATTCPVPSSAMSGDWYRGMVQVLKNQADDEYIECAYLLRSDDAARRVYADVALFIETRLALDPAPSPHIAQQSAAATRSERGLVGHAVAFRRGNLVVRLSYFGSGPGTVSLKSLEHSARIVNVQLR